MCYLCGPDKAAKTINEALRVWRRKLSNAEEGQKSFRRTWGYSHDWTLPPKRPRLPRVELGMETLGDGLWPAA